MSLSKKNKDIIIEAVSKYGKDLEGKLSPHPDLPARNPYAHIWKSIKDHFGKSYKDCDDEDAEEIVELIKKIASAH